LSLVSEGYLRKGVLKLQELYSQEEAEAFFRQEYPYLFRYAFYLTSNRELSEELCQETFLRWFKQKNYREIEAPRAWLRKVMSRLAINDMRRRKLRGRLEIELPPDKIDTIVSIAPEILRLEVEDVLQRLPWKEQMLLKMKMSGMSYAEMADVMEVSIGSVGTMLARAMKKFKYEYQGKEAGRDHEMPGRGKTLTIFG